MYDEVVSVILQISGGRTFEMKKSMAKREGGNGAKRESA
jgi:hypothetical protein